MKKSAPGLIAERFLRSIATYEDEAIVQKEVGRDCISLLSMCPGVSFSKVLEVGCCTGMMSEELSRKYMIEDFYLNDLVPGFCEYSGNRVERFVKKVISLPGDIERIDLPQQLDLLISSSTLQWVTDLPGCLSKMHGSLKPGGFLLCSFFGAGTMCQVKELTGVGLDYVDDEELQQVLQRKYTLIKQQKKRRRLYFKSPREVLKHIQRTGVSGVREFRWTPKSLRQFEEQYRQKYKEAEGVPLDYVSLFVVAQKQVEGG